jgi:PAS domain-containing protein
MFTQQLAFETLPSIADSPATPSLNDSDTMRRLLERHTGFAQFRVVLPGTMIWSAAAAKMRGHGDHQTETPLEDAVLAYVPEDRARVIDTITDAIHDRKGFRIMARRMVGDKTKVIEILGDVKVENGTVTEFFGLTRDISDTVEREALGISRARLIRRMVEDMPVPVVVLDRALRIVACSGAWARSYGLASRKEAIGKPINKLLTLGRETTAAMIEAMAGRTARIALDFYGGDDGRPVKRSGVVLPWQCGTDAAGGVLMMVGEAQPPFASLDIADRALGRRTKGLMEILEAM